MSVLIMAKIIFVVIAFVPVHLLRLSAAAAIILKRSGGPMARVKWGTQNDVKNNVKNYVKNDVNTTSETSWGKHLPPSFLRFFVRKLLRASSCLVPLDRVALFAELARPLSPNLTGAAMSYVYAPKWKPQESPLRNMNMCSQPIGSTQSDP